MLRPPGETQTMSSRYGVLTMIATPYLSSDMARSTFAGPQLKPNLVSSSLSTSENLLLTDLLVLT